MLVETEGSAESIGLAPHYRLRNRIERHIAERQEAPKALMVINGYRDMPPAGRAKQYEDALKVAAGAMRYCLLDTATLFEAVRAKMAGQDEAVGTFLEAVLATEGVYQGPTPVVPEAEEVQEDDEDVE